MNNHLEQLNKKIAIEKIKNESLRQQIEDQTMLESMQDYYFDMLINYFNYEENDLIAELCTSYENDMVDFTELKEECLTIAKGSAATSEYIDKIEAINLPVRLNSNSLEDAMSFLRTDVHNAMLQLYTIRRELREENKIRIIDSLL